MKQKLEASLKDLNISEKEFKELSEIFSNKKTPLLNKVLSNVIASLFIFAGAVFIRDFPVGEVKSVLLFIAWVCMTGLAYILSGVLKKCKMLLFKEKVSNFVLNQVMTDLSKLQKEIDAEKAKVEAEN